MLCGAETVTCLRQGPEAGRQVRRALKYEDLMVVVWSNGADSGSGDESWLDF